ncbi:hypothetical protein Goshw_030412, partial [Gossypium schwendimanii]|nr:hypothetical protein [Gossypium schwendimanii]
MVFVMFAGHLGEVKLAGSKLAHSWATVTDFAFMTSLSGALKTLCGQGFGAKIQSLFYGHICLRFSAKHIEVYSDIKHCYTFGRVFRRSIGYPFLDCAPMAASISI